MNKRIVLAAATLICTGIILGAFGAHSLEKMVSEDGQVIFEKGVRYQMYMGLGLLVVGLNAEKFSFNLSWFFKLSLTGVLIFSVLLYVLAFKEHVDSLRILGAFVPIGGTMMIVAWGILVFNLFKKQNH